MTLHFRDRYGATSLYYRNRAEITVLMCEQKPSPGLSGMVFLSARSDEGNVLLLHVFLSTQEFVRLSFCL